MLSIVSVKKPMKDASLHLRSEFMATSCLEMLLAAGGAIPAPKADGEVTAVPANSILMELAPVLGL